MDAPILLVSAPERGQAFLRRWRGTRPLFCCVLAHTDTCFVPGISAAGATEALRAFTPAADAEAVVLGAPRCLPGLPVNPLGPPGPAGITRAAVTLGQLPVEFVAAGLREWPAVPLRRVRCEPGGAIEQGRAVPEAADLFVAGVAIGQELGREHPHLVLGESVPGGTTTALALLLALGVDAVGRVSGSVAGNAHEAKERLARAALRAAGLTPGDGRPRPLHAAGCVGDPMQPLAAGIALGATQTGAEVLLAGGSQMLAVAALLAAQEGTHALERVAVGTTRWVTHDPAADVPGLAAQVSPRLPLLAINLDFSRSRHSFLHPYEHFLVKEGVGAGGSCIAALLAAGRSLDDLQQAIDDVYERVESLESSTRPLPPAVAPGAGVPR